jgi:hypothetical protein
MMCYDIDSRKWFTREQKSQQRYGRRNQTCMILSKFMVIYGGLNDFAQQMGDLIIYNL